MLDNANERPALVDLREFIWWNTVKHLTLWETTETRQGEGLSLLGAFERFRLPLAGVVQEVGEKHGSADL